ncbi:MULTISPECIES: hypothetical protein [Rhizobium]|uniref:hypothetical protein n=1 Tax=Rhizobium TaxID=379 RepID=UPI0017B17CBC|nr:MULTISPECIES: hypothetical protein [Rhizobium]
MKFLERPDVVDTQLVPLFQNKSSKSLRRESKISHDADERAVFIDHAFDAGFRDVVFRDPDLVAVASTSSSFVLTTTLLRFGPRGSFDAGLRFVLQNGYRLVCKLVDWLRLSGANILRILDRESGRQTSNVQALRRWFRAWSSHWSDSDGFHICAGARSTFFYLPVSADRVSSFRGICSRRKARGDRHRQ